MKNGTDETLVIDVSDVPDATALHELLFTFFRFPDYYGGNWDAFDECIRDVEVPASVVLIGFSSLVQHLPREAELLLSCLNDFAAERSGEVKVHVS